mmetsp:Transcript_46010/g.55371  ORF Transcript_46010/g.55371 Transcript_46010/m.55371 type:complete len:131 (-) Transcript_46010:1661-2053(-)
MMDQPPRILAQIPETLVETPHDQDAVPVGLVRTDIPPVVGCHVQTLREGGEDGGVEGYEGGVEEVGHEGIEGLGEEGGPQREFVFVGSASRGAVGGGCGGGEDEAVHVHDILHGLAPALGDRHGLVRHGC